MHETCLYVPLRSQCFHQNCLVSPRAAQRASLSRVVNRPSAVAAPRAGRNSHRLGIFPPRPCAGDKVMESRARTCFPDDSWQRGLIMFALLRDRPIICLPSRSQPGTVSLSRSLSSGRSPLLPRLSLVATPALWLSAVAPSSRVTVVLVSCSCCNPVDDQLCSCFVHVFLC